MTLVLSHPRLILCGLLSANPEKSNTFRKLKEDRRLNAYDKMHITATVFTPGLSRRWVRYQFGDVRRINARMMRAAYANREKYEHLGRENVQYMGLKEVERYFERHPPGERKTIPFWAVAIIKDLYESGMSQLAIAEKFDIASRAVWNKIHLTSVFDGPKTNPGLWDNNPMLKKKKG